MWSALLSTAGFACSGQPTYRAAPVNEPARAEPHSRVDGPAAIATSEPAQLLEIVECKSTYELRDPMEPVSEDENEKLGLVCFGKPARYFCPRDDGPRCGERFLVLVDESGEPLEEQFRHGRLCNRKKLLYGCNRKDGNEFIPFIHTQRIEFTPSGFALMAEEYRSDKQQGGYFYADSRYDQKLEAATIDCIPEPLLPLNTVRYEKDGKIGFLDLRKGIVTPPMFNGAYSFWNGQGRTLVCEDCHPMRWSLCAPPEAQCTGTAYLIDEQGRRIREKPSEEYVEYWRCKRRPGEKLDLRNDSACQ